MKAWKATLKVADVFHNDGLSLSEKAAQIRHRLAPIGQQVDPDWCELDLLLDNLAEAGALDSLRAFDAAWNDIYDWADDNRVWIETR